MSAEHRLNGLCVTEPRHSAARERGTRFGFRDEISEVSLRVMREREREGEEGQRRGYHVGGTRSEFVTEFGSRDRPRVGGRNALSALSLSATGKPRSEVCLDTERKLYWQSARRINAL